MYANERGPLGGGGEGGEYVPRLNFKPFDVAISDVSHVAGFSFEAGGRSFRPVVSHSMSGTLIPMFESFFYYSLFFI